MISEMCDMQDGSAKCYCPHCYAFSSSYVVITASAVLRTMCYLWCPRTYGLFNYVLAPIVYIHCPSYDSFSPRNNVLFNYVLAPISYVHSSSYNAVCLSYNAPSTTSQLQCCTISFVLATMPGRSWTKSNPKYVNGTGLVFGRSHVLSAVQA